MLHIVAAVAITTMVPIAERQVPVRTLRLGKVDEVVVQRLHSSQICHGPQHRVPEVVDQPQKRPARILQQCRQKHRLLMPMTTHSVHRKTCVLKTRGKKRIRRCRLLPSPLPLPHNRSPGLASP